MPPHMLSALRRFCLIKTWCMAVLPQMSFVCSTEMQAVSHRFPCLRQIRDCDEGIEGLIPGDGAESAQMV